jgi:hypothetical protein
LLHQFTSSERGDEGSALCPSCFTTEKRLPQQIMDRRLGMLWSSSFLPLPEIESVTNRLNYLSSEDHKIEKSILQCYTKCSVGKNTYWNVVVLFHDSEASTLCLTRMQVIILALRNGSDVVNKLLCTQLDSTSVKILSFLQKPPFDAEVWKQDSYFSAC